MTDDSNKPQDQQEKNNDLPIVEGIDEAEPTDEDLLAIAHEEPEAIHQAKQSNGEVGGVDIGLGTANTNITGELNQQSDDDSTQGVKEPDKV
jgi:hypothetical protein